MSDQLAVGTSASGQAHTFGRPGEAFTLTSGASIKKLAALSLSKPNELLTILNGTAFLGAEDLV
jgi:hypothetical protein